MPCKDLLLLAIGRGLGKRKYPVVQTLGSRKPSRTTDENLIVHLLKTHLYLLFRKLEGPLGPPFATPLIDLVYMIDT